jgi:hypothetical protein
VQRIDLDVLEVAAIRPARRYVALIGEQLMSATALYLNVDQTVHVEVVIVVVGRSSLRCRNTFLALSAFRCGHHFQIRVIAFLGSP